MYSFLLSPFSGCDVKVFQSCKSHLLEMASPDALIRLRSTPLVDEQTALCEIYMKKQHHSSIEAFIKFHISSTKSNNDVLMQVCHSIAAIKLSSLATILHFV